MTEAGIKQHIAQSPPCCNQWTKHLDQMKSTVSNDAEDQPLVVTNDDAPEWGNVFDGMDGADDTLDIPDGHLVHQSHVDDDSGPPDLCKPPSKHM